MVPRDIATREIFDVCVNQGLGIDGKNEVYLDISHIPAETLDKKLGGIMEIYEKFNSIVGDKTAVYISHRLSSCKFCDQITVFDHGSVIQQGSHEDLLADTDGEYARLWQAQAQYYTK